MEKIVNKRTEATDPLLESRRSDSFNWGGSSQVSAHKAAKADGSCFFHENAGSSDKTLRGSLSRTCSTISGS